MEHLGFILDDIVWLVTQLREHKLSWALALLIVGATTLIGGVIGCLLSTAVMGVGVLAGAGFVIGVGILYVIAKKRELEREWEWTKTVEPSQDPDPFAGWPRHE
jgi:hypothetical protein